MSTSLIILTQQTSDDLASLAWRCVLLGIGLNHAANVAETEEEAEQYRSAAKQADDMRQALTAWAVRA